MYKEQLKFIPWNEITERMKLDGTKSYIIMPCTYKPGVRGPFTLSVHTNVDFELKPYVN